ncbi:MarR family transcriptional regulator [Devosia sp. 1566]|uniref:MarR family winged helix-turn-helix transcriptional regulator n=1 Tax=Devosia sp. 1566 TaxID=2499144 RepID=UPI000FDC0E26|nr:MarR family transcriptional regulator [Devosia sp. 1566]
MSRKDDDRVMRSVHKERTEPRRQSRQLSATTHAAPAEPTPQMSTLVASVPMWSHPGFLLRRLHQIHSAMFEERQGSQSLTEVQFALLSILAQGEDLDQTALAGASGIDRSNVADVLKRLEVRGLVRRTAGLEDKRLVLVEITEKGRGLVGVAEQQLRRVDDQMLSQLNPGDRQQFIDLLMRVLETTNQHGRTRLRAPPVHRK